MKDEEEDKEKRKKEEEKEKEKKKKEERGGEKRYIIHYRILDAIILIKSPLCPLNIHSLIPFNRPLSCADTHEFIYVPI
jgi:hypothetical protein